MQYCALMWLLLSPALTLPLDQPVRVDLPVYGLDTSTDSDVAQPLEPENHPGEDRRDRTLVTNLLAHKLQAASGVLKNQIASHSVGLFPQPVTKLESALLETEGLGSRKLSIKENLHSFMAGIFQPKPIVDIISEEEKYGNNGDKFYTVGKAVVGGAEGVSNLVNSVLEVPGAIFRSITRAATEKLNNLGGKLIGL